MQWLALALTKPTIQTKANNKAGPLDLFLLASSPPSEQYNEAIKIESNKHEAYNNCGIVLATLAKLEDKELAKSWIEE